jgi:hypothetical protein
MFITSGDSDITLFALSSATSPHVPRSNLPPAVPVVRVTGGNCQSTSIRHAAACEENSSTFSGEYYALVIAEFRAAKSTRTSGKSGRKSGIFSLFRY